MIYRAISFLIFAVLIASLFFWWNQLNGFDALDMQWWIWLFKYVKATDALPEEFYLPLYTITPLLAIAPAFVLAVGNRAKNRTSGDRKSNELHGTARWAQKKDLKQAGLIQKQRVVVGGRKSFFGKIVPLLHNGPEHVLVFAPSRSGKGVGLVIPTLLTWLQSVLVLDIKGEIYAMTAGWRKLIGQKVLKFAPASPNGSTRFNPLAEIRIGTDHVIADCQNVALMMIDPDGKGLKDHWMKDGWDWLSNMLLHVLHKTKIEEKRDANLSDVMLFVSGVINEAENDEDAANEGFNELLNDMMAYDHQDYYVNQAVRSGCASMKIKAFSEKSGVHSSAKEPLNLYRDPIIAKNLECSDFSLRELMNGDDPASLYLVIPPKEIKRLRPLIRMVMNMFLNFQMEDLEFENGEQKKTRKYDMLLMLDEFTSIGKLDIFQDSLAYMAGYGLKAYIIVQDRAQLTSEKTGYGRDEAISSNCHVQAAYAPNKVETAEYLSKRLGKATYVQHKKSTSKKAAGGGSAGTSESIGETGRDLLTPSECMLLQGAIKSDDGKKILKAGAMLTMVAGFAPFLGIQYLFFFQKHLLERSQIPAPQPYRKD
ncbi:MAG: type IV secretory system conjugative DNA transfer family protein [Methylocystaceae bacterium]|nr:type IV secretory system conjugative DNA transfer family protein [Methylocystaceae bacterium]